MRRSAPLLLLAVATFACAGTDVAGAGGLAGDWQLTAATGPDGPILVPDDGPVTLRIDDDGWRGEAHCNLYTAEADVDGEEVTVHGVGGTERGCLDQDRMAAEAAYYDALSSATSVTVEEGLRLTLRGQDIELVYAPVEPEPDAAPVGTWHLETLLEGTGPDGAASSVPADATLELGDDGTFDAGTGCNTLSGTYTDDAGTLRFEGASRTDAACPPAGPEQALEDHVEAVLGGTATGTIDGGTLTIGAGDRGLVYRSGEGAG